MHATLTFCFLQAPAVLAYAEPSAPLPGNCFCAHIWGAQQRPQTFATHTHTHFSQCSLVQRRLLNCTQPMCSIHCRPINPNIGKVYSCADVLCPRHRSLAPRALPMEATSTAAKRCARESESSFLGWGRRLLRRERASRCGLDFLLPSVHSGTTFSTPGSGSLQASSPSRPGQLLGPCTGCTHDESFDMLCCTTRSSAHILSSLVFVSTGAKKLVSSMLEVSGRGQAQYS